MLDTLFLTDKSITEFDAILVAGPTASGKSAFALELAQKHNGIILNADSMQVYQDLRILTARPSPQEEELVPHRLYGFISSHHAYSTGQWTRDVEKALQEAHQQKQLPIITGGTGLYFSALLKGLSPVPDIAEDIRQKWRAKGEELEVCELYDILQKSDPVMAARLRPSDPQRILRALEVLEATGHSLAYWQTIPGTPLLQEDRVLKFVICPERDILYQRCDHRFLNMIEQGGLEEVSTFLKEHPLKEHSVKGRSLPEHASGTPLMGALGLKPLIAHLENKLSLDEAISLSQRDTRRYAKRQLTWLRRNMIAWKWI